MCSAFIQFFSIVITNLTITCEILTCFFLKKYIKSGNITEKKNKTLKDFYYFLKLKCWQNRKKKKEKEFNEEFIAMWRGKKSLWDVKSSLYRHENEKGKSSKKMSDKFQICSH